mgnify:CR=1 FL=1
MADVNKTIVMGRLVSNAETKTTKDGLFIANFSIATNRSKKNESGFWEEIPSFFDLSLFGKRAEKLSPYLLKGQKVIIEGHLIQKKWEKDGKKQSKIVIEIEQISLIGGNQTKNKEEYKEENLYDNEVPAEMEIF